MKKLLLGVISIFHFTTAYADNIRTETYSPDKIYTIYTKVGHVTLVQLEDDETLNEVGAVGVGDAEAWNVAVRKNNILFKPKANLPDTNMIVVSDKGRTYIFDLKASNTKTSYVVRFTYPHDKHPPLSYQHRDQANNTHFNTNYWGKGSKSLEPTSIYDDGRFTYLKFNNNRSMPSFYKKEADGTETLLNTHIEHDTVVIHETAARLILRLGREVLELANRSYDAHGSFNITGTNNNNSIRLIQGKE